MTETDVLSKHRIEALTDGIYAVAMTLLVLELKLPEAHGTASDEALREALLHLIPKVVAWILSFAILAIFWFAHHRTFHYVRHVDRKLLRINLISMLFASLLPFSSAMVGDYNNLFRAQALYAANMAALALFTIWQLSHRVNHPELCEPPGFPPRDARDLVPALRLLARNARPDSAPWQSPWEREQSDAEVAAWEVEQFEASVKHLRTLE
jgi:uncharacterized membrane protein